MVNNEGKFYNRFRLFLQSIVKGEGNQWKSGVGEFWVENNLTALGYTGQDTKKEKSWKKIPRS